MAKGMGDGFPLAAVVTTPGEPRTELSQVHYPVILEVMRLYIIIFSLAVVVLEQKFVLKHFKSVLALFFG